jgi:hypothetical protein
MSHGSGASGLRRGDGAGGTPAAGAGGSQEGVGGAGGRPVTEAEFRDLLLREAGYWPDVDAVDAKDLMVAPFCLGAMG